MMQHANNATNMMINQQVSTYKASLSSWSNQVRGARNTMDAFRIASQKPAPGALIRSLKSMTNGDRIRAENTVERILQDRASELQPDDPNLLNIMRLTQGHWPQVWRNLDQKRRSKVIS